MNYTYALLQQTTYLAKVTGAETLSVVKFTNKFAMFQSIFVTL